jgi:hypothetical protein
MLVAQVLNRFELSGSLECARISDCLAQTCNSISGMLFATLAVDLLQEL